VRYLQAAIMKLDGEQYRMVKEALFERANLVSRGCGKHILHNTPSLSAGNCSASQLPTADHASHLQVLDCLECDK
jgi:hypothetical protein